MTIVVIERRSVVVVVVARRASDSFIALVRVVLYHRHAPSIVFVIDVARGQRDDDARASVDDADDDEWANQRTHERECEYDEQCDA